VEPCFIREPHKIEDSKMFIKKCLEPPTICHALFTIRFFQLVDGRDAVGMNLGFLGGSMSCWLGHASLLWQSTQGFLRRVQKMMSHVLRCVLGHTGARASMCCQQSSRRSQLVHQMMYRRLRRSCSVTKLLAKLTLNSLIRSRFPVRFHYETTLCNSLSDHLDRCTDSRQECLNHFTLARHTNTIAYPDRRSYRCNWH
jgi:hypothetical protein